MSEHLSPENMHRIDPWRLRKGTVTTFKIFTLHPKYPLSPVGEDLVMVQEANHNWTPTEIRSITEDKRIFFIKKTDVGAWETYIESNAIIKKDMTPSSKIQKLEDVAFDLFSTYKNVPLNAEVVEEFKHVAVGVVDTLRESTDAAKFIRGLFEHSEFLYHHATGVGILAPSIALEMGEASDEILREYSLGGLLHDTGMLDISNDILLKQGPLSDAEWEIIRRHPEKGLEKVQSIPGVTKRMHSMFSLHHERFDRSGYPHGYNEPLIPDEARIMAIADVFNALTSSRPYRPKRNHFEALKLLKHEQKGKFWPPAIEALIRVLAPD